MSQLWCLHTGKVDSSYTRTSTTSNMSEHQRILLGLLLTQVCNINALEKLLLYKLTCSSWGLGGWFDQLGANSVLGVCVKFDKKIATSVFINNSRGTGKVCKRRINFDFEKLGRPQLSWTRSTRRGGQVTHSTCTTCSTGTHR